MVNVFARYRKHGPAPARGFSIIELMVTVAVAAVLIGLAIPSFRDLLISNKVMGTSTQLLGDLNVAKAEAVRRGSLVAVISNSGTNDWSTGWHVETDGDFAGNGTFAAIPIASGNDVLLRANTGVDTSANYKVTTRLTTAACASATTPQSDGMVIFNSQGNQPCNVNTFDINICRPDSNPARSKRITISASGMVTTQASTTSSPAPGC